MKKSGDDGTIPQPGFCIPAWPRDAPSPGGEGWDEGGVKLRIPRSAIERPSHQHLRACLETTRGAAARDFGCGQGGEFRASPQRAVRNEPTSATDKRPAARRVFGEKAVWLCCSSVEDPPGIFSFVAPSGLLPENSAPRSFQTGSEAGASWNSALRSGGRSRSHKQLDCNPLRNVLTCPMQVWYWA